MYAIRTISILGTLALCLSLSAQPVSRCGSELGWRQLSAEQAAQRQRSLRTMEAWLASAETRNNELITIPVVVHIVYRTLTENISDAQVYSQMEVLNQDFRATNDNLGIVPLNFQGLISDTEIEFCLASVDPDGNPTTGITRTQTPKDNIGWSSDVHYDNKDGKDAWDTQHYLNIWVADMGSNAGGRATFPGEAPPAEDGIVIDPRFFGTIGLAADSEPYHLGRTTVHEIGHYLNLEHVWGPGAPSCDVDDFVEDTPNSSKSYLQECPQEIQFTCGSTDMYTNYLYYTDDACMAQFTPGQKNRMLATLYTVREGLRSGPGCQPIVGVAPEPQSEFRLELSPNPSDGPIQICCVSPVPDDCHWQLYAATGQYLRSGRLTPNLPAYEYWPELPPGVYFFHLQQSGRRLAKRLIIN
ncbi:MAG: hypothetical protein KDC41_07665 [Saprospiraceae bacterium]|nr:hypothetical protein [Saprospiraceae bacterium]